MKRRMCAQPSCKPDGAQARDTHAPMEIPQKRMNEPRNTASPETELLHDSFGASPMGIAVETMEGQPLFVNPALCSMLGFSKEEMRSKHCVDFSPSEDAEKDWSLFQRLRAGSIDNYQLEKRYFRGDGSLMWGRLSVSLLGGHATPRVLAMVEDITEEKRAQESEIGQRHALQQSEERLRLAQQAARIGTFESNLRTGATTWTPELEAIYGFAPGTFGGRQAHFLNMIHPDDRAGIPGFIDLSIKSGEPSTAEWRIVRPDGAVRWITARWQVFRDESGEPLRMIGVNMDITERKLSEQALAEIPRKLIEAQEQERARIGRELHDDINQRLALLSMEIEQLKDRPGKTKSLVKELRERIGEISTDVQALAHDLHPSRLEYLGAVAGMKSWMKDFGLRQKLDLDFTTDVRSELPPAIGISLFRVLQEALQNTVKHSGGGRIEVQLREESDALHLVVKDSGKGFDVDAVSQGKGLGLTSMRERVRLVNGTITIRSTPERGTCIRVRVPLGVKEDSPRPAG
jgi:PAS domain S-box-containing protein